MDTETLIGINCVLSCDPIVSVSVKVNMIDLKATSTHRSNLATVDVLYCKGLFLRNKYIHFFMIVYLLGYIII